MAFRERKESDELKIFRLLSYRSILPSKEKLLYANLEKGFQGEVMFDQFTEGLDPNKFLILNDLLLETNSTTFQLDSFLISQGTHFPCEVKNFEGDFYYKSDQFHAMNDTVIQNPLDQIKKSNTLLLQFLQKKKYSISLKSNVFFVNPSFTLYQAPLDKPIIYPTQHAKYFEELNKRSSILTDDHYKLAEDLVKEHKTTSPYSRLPPYDFYQLKKGPSFMLCHSYAVSFDGKIFICHSCGCLEYVDDAILRAVGELQLLFPDIKITTNLIFEWFKVIESRKQIRRILKKHYQKMGLKHVTYYK
ncbi:nuclease-related domain-containing protein [Neobacillus sp. 3P2-tot-E-2]|uniref:nuclease-related domain-containing protein n=1 Tax=Neobacillus sp. 3P2-tot-E-2 TaxID=3132212 RepID=UPI0039A016CC